MNFYYFLCLPITLALTSCATDIGSSNYNTSSVGIAQTSIPGVIIAMRPVTINNDSANPGSVIGTGAGAAVGALAGGSKHRFLGAGIGGAAGLVSGQLLGKKIAQKQGFEYQIRASNGHIYTIIQGNDIILSIGQHVMVILPQGKAKGRLIPCN